MRKYAYRDFVVFEEDDPDAPGIEASVSRAIGDRLFDYRIRVIDRTENGRARLAAYIDEVIEEASIAIDRYVAYTDKERS